MSVSPPKVREAGLTTVDLHGIQTGNVPTRSGLPGWWSRHLERSMLVVALILLLAICMVSFPQFRTPALFIAMINAQALTLLLALIATIVLRVGDFDFSIPQTMVATAALVVMLAKAGVPIPLASAVGIVLGLMVGVLNAILVVRAGVDSFVATLGSFTALSGLAWLLTDNRVIVGVPQIWIDIARTKLFELPLITWYAWVLMGLLWYIYEMTPLGKYMLFIGGNRNAAQLCGIPVQRIRFGSYIASGMLASLMGILFTGYFSSVDPGAGSQFMLQPFAAAFLGATAVSVGRFNAIGTAVALYFLTVGITGLQLLGAQTWVTNVFYGVALMAAVTAAKLAGRFRSGG